MIEIDYNKHTDSEGVPTREFWNIWGMYKDELKEQGWRVFLHKKTDKWRLTNVATRGNGSPGIFITKSPAVNKKKEKGNPLWPNIQKDLRRHNKCGNDQSGVFMVFKYWLGSDGIEQVVVKTGIKGYQLALCWADDLRGMSETPDMDGFYFVKPCNGKKHQKRVQLWKEWDTDFLEYVGIEDPDKAEELYQDYFF